MHWPFARPTAADTTSATPAAESPALKPRSQSSGLTKISAAPAPASDIMSSPGYWNSMPDISPPGMPFWTTPMAKDTCVDVGPGMHCPRESSSLNTVGDIHRFASTKTFSKRPMCAAGPPNAVQPMSTKLQKMSLYEAFTRGCSCFSGSSVVSTLTWAAMVTCRSLPDKFN